MSDHVGYEPRPDEVTCVATGRYDRPEDHPRGPHREQRSWCGRDVGFEFSFVDASHAALAAPRGRLVPCPRCVGQIKAALDGVDVLPKLP